MSQARPTVGGFSADGRLFTVDMRGELHSWMPGTREARLLASNLGIGTSLAFVPGTPWVAIGTQEGVSRLRSSVTGQARDLHHHEGLVNSLDVTSDGRYLAAASADRTAILWDLATGEPRVLRGPQRLASADENGGVWLWAPSSGKGQRLGAHGAKVWRLAFSPDGGHLASAGEDKVVRLWNVSTGESRTLTGHAIGSFAARCARGFARRSPAGAGSVPRRRDGGTKPPHCATRRA
ncbi:hypothetical protein JQX13_45730 [Archangium violaceum]|nr:hypothetical protein JQX13_45730 [Archangium violaceum]